MSGVTLLGARPAGIHRAGDGPRTWVSLPDRPAPRNGVAL
jgi:hypothetical protein